MHEQHFWNPYKDNKKKHPVYSKKLLSSFALMEQETVVPAINKNTYILVTCATVRFKGLSAEDFQISQLTSEVLSLGMAALEKTISEILDLFWAWLLCFQKLWSCVCRAFFAGTPSIPLQAGCNLSARWASRIRQLCNYHEATYLFNRWHKSTF